MQEQTNQVLIVDDCREMCEILDHLVRQDGLESTLTEDGASALDQVRLKVPDVVLLDVVLPDMNGMDVLKRIRRLDPDIPVIMMTGQAGIQGAVDAMKVGAHDYISKPFDNTEVLRVVRRALNERDLKLKVRDLSDKRQGNPTLREVMGPSDQVARLVDEVNQVARSDFSVLIIGETGSGKELIARAIHEASLRKPHPLVPVDCGAIPENLLESELFGHEKGSFTGASQQKPGKFETAGAGTLFLDEITNMPLNSQAKLLRALQDRKACRVGGVCPVPLDARLLAASNQDLESSVASKAFRRDLYYRLNEFTITIPPLRRRREDIPYLSKRFLDAANLELKKTVRGFTEPAIEILLAHDWPGNVRQLRSTIRRATLLADEIVTEKELVLKGRSDTGVKLTPRVQGQPWENLSLKEILRRSTLAVEREIIGQVLKQTGGNKAKAARILKIDYKTIHTKLKYLGLQKNRGTA